MSGRTLVLCLSLLGAALLALTVFGCSRPTVPPIVLEEPEPRAALLFDPRPSWPPATEIGRSDWPSTPGVIEGPEFGSYRLMIYDFQGGTGYGYGWGGWNNYQRQFIGYRVGTTIR